MRRLAARVARLEALEREREEREFDALLQAVTDVDLEQFIAGLDELIEAAKLGTLSEEQLEARGAELHAWLRDRAQGSKV